MDRSSFSPSGDIYNSTRLAIKDHRKQYGGRAGIDYTFNNKNSVSLSLGGGEVDVFTTINSNVKNIGQTGLDFAFNENNYETPVKYFNSSLNFDHKFTPGVNGISFEVTYTNVSLPGIRNSAEFVTDDSYTSRNADPLKTRFENDVDRNEGRIKLNFNQKINDQSSFELGIQSNLSYRNFNIENMLFDWNSASYIADSGLTNKFDPGINLYGSSFNGNIVGMNINKNIYNWTARLNTTVIIDSDTRLQFGGNYFGKINQPQVEIKPFFILNASLKRDFFDKKLSLTLQARNLLTTSNLDIISNGTNFNSVIFVHGEVPVISLMIGYNFNNFKKTRTGNDNIDIRSGL